MDKNLPKGIDAEKVYEAIAEGVDRAIWRMITNATDAPCSDFYNTIQSAAREAFEKLLPQTEIVTNCNRHGDARD